MTERKKSRQGYESQLDGGKPELAINMRGRGFAWTPDYDREEIQLLRELYSKPPDLAKKKKISRIRRGIHAILLLPLSFLWHQIHVAVRTM